MVIGDGSGSMSNYGGDEVVWVEWLVKFGVFMSYKGFDDEWFDLDEDEDEGYYDYLEDG